MKVIFLGVGAAIDSELPNNSCLVNAKGVNLLLDCGPSVPPQVWKYNLDPNLLDAVCISHRHWDHYSGLPQLLLQMSSEGRQKPLWIFCQDWLNRRRLKTLMDLAYHGSMEYFQFKIYSVKIAHGLSLDYCGLNLSFENTIHTIDNTAIRINDGEVKMVYTGDGRPLNGSSFYKEADLLVAETYLYDLDMLGHFSVVSAIKLAEENKVKNLALTHLAEDFRRNALSGVRHKICSDKVEILIPQPMQELFL